MIRAVTIVLIVSVNTTTHGYKACLSVSYLVVACMYSSILETLDFMLIRFI